MPPGFAIEVYAEVPGARSLALGENGIVYVGTQRSGTVTALLPRPGGKPEVIEIASGLNVPNGVAFRDGALYVAEISRILRYDDIDRPPARPARAGGRDRHASRRRATTAGSSSRFGPDGKLYVPVGAPCNVCVPEPDRYALDLRINPDGTGYEVFARGVRNTRRLRLAPAHGGAVVHRATAAT